jgi:hypothetical protein
MDGYNGKTMKQNKRSARNLNRKSWRIYNGGSTGPYSLARSMLIMSSEVITPVSLL